MARQRYVLACVMMLTIGACHRAEPRIATFCTPTEPPSGDTSVTLAIATRADSQALASGVGGLVIHVLDGRDKTKPIEVALVRLSPIAARPNPVSFPYGGGTDGNGQVEIRNVEPGEYDVQTRRIGYEARALEFIVRRGYIDTVRVAVRWQPMCLV